MLILGLNAHHPDASVALIKDGELLWGAEEERFSRVKHASGFPVLSLKACLKETGIEFSDIAFVALSRNPKANLLRKILFTLINVPEAKFVLNRMKAFCKTSGFADDFWTAMGRHEEGQCPNGKSSAPCFLHVEHHLAHAASAYYVSGFDKAAFLSLDGLGDFSSAMWGLADGRQFCTLDRIYFPHSAGFLYTAGTQFLGFLNFGDEYKVMGLAAYGKPVFIEQFRKMVVLKPRGRFALNLDYFMQHKGQVKIRWEGGRPEQDILYSPKWSDVFGTPRSSDDPITQREQDIASSLQGILEEIYFHILNHLYEETHLENLCLAGGVAYNSVANGKITSKTGFKNVYIPPAAGDAGTAIGAALYVYSRMKTASSHSVSLSPQGSALSSQDSAQAPQAFIMSHAFYGSKFSDDDIEEFLKEKKVSYEKLSEDELLRETVKSLIEKKIVGWFQGRMEFGPRALGNRSILADPRYDGMKETLNLRIKLRENFRPFAPAVPEEYAQEYFEMAVNSSPFMAKVFPVRPEKKSVLPAITHVDGSARVQTVSREKHPVFWRLLTEFGKKTGVYVLLNTSFNENEPIVRTPGEALDCFLKTKMDVLVLGRCLVQR
jgi:carbamoyltransferase